MVYGLPSTDGNGPGTVTVHFVPLENATSIVAPGSIDFPEDGPERPVSIIFGTTKSQRRIASKCWAGVLRTGRG